MTTILWMYYWHANEIFIKSDQLTFAVYSSSWYEFPLKLQKSIYIFMLYRPIRLNAGYLNMTLDVFITVSSEFSKLYSCICSFHYCLSDPSVVV